MKPNYLFKKSLYRVKKLHPWLFTNRVYWKTRAFTNKGVNFMKNRSFIIGLAFAGLATQVFTLISTGALKDSYVDAFNAASVISLFSALILTIWSLPCPKDSEREREDMYRDFDGLYRYVDDANRDIRVEISNLARNVDDADRGIRDEISDLAREALNNCKNGKK